VIQIIKNIELQYDQKITPIVDYTSIDTWPQEEERVQYKPLNQTQEEDEQGLVGIKNVSLKMKMCNMMLYLNIERYERIIEIP